MFYQVLRLFMKLVLRVFLRKVYFSGADLIPNNKPVILACNHPNSFLDAVLLAVLCKRPLHFLARSDVFNTPLKRFLLGKLHLIPVYRLEEGAENLHRNAETFSRCYHILKNNGLVLIFSEGVCVQEKRLRPLRKGTARLAFDAAARQHFNLDVQVVPVGLNYTYPDQFRREVMIGVRPPIAVKSFESLFYSSPAKARQQFNRFLRQELEKSIISIALPQQEKAAEACFRLNRATCPDYFSPAWFSYRSYRLQTEQEIARNLPPPEAVAAGKVFPAAMSPSLPRNPGRPFGPWFLLGLPLALLALAFQAPPVLSAQWITRSQVYKREFYASVLMGVGMVLYLVYWLGVSVGLLLGLGWQGLAWSLLLPFTGYLGLLWLDRYRLWQLRRLVCVSKRPPG